MSTFGLRTSDRAGAEPSRVGGASEPGDLDAEDHATRRPKR